MNKLMQSEEGKKEIIKLKILNQEEENKKYKKVLNQNIDEEQIKKLKEELSKEEQEEILEYTGCTAISIIIDEKKNKLYFANIGNSMAIIIGKDYSQIFESKHRPTDISEKSRIEKAKGLIINDKLYGVLNVARTFGDFAYIHNNNNKIIIDQPDFKEYDIKDSDEFIFIATESIIELFDKDKIGDTLKDLVKSNNSYDLLKKKINDIIKGNIVNDFYNNDTELGFDNMTYTLIQIKTKNK
jgi:protein phosphatase 2C family protein 2/3